MLPRTALYRSDPICSPKYPVLSTESFNFFKQLMFQQILLILTPKRKKMILIKQLNFKYLSFPFIKLFRIFTFSAAAIIQSFTKKRSILIRQDLHHSFRNNYHIISCLGCYKDVKRSFKDALVKKS